MIITSFLKSGQFFFPRSTNLLFGLVGPKPNPVQGPSQNQSLQYLCCLQTRIGHESKWVGCGKKLQPPLVSWKNFKPLTTLQTSKYDQLSEILGSFHLVNLVGQLQLCVAYLTLKVILAFTDKLKKKKLYFPLNHLKAIMLSRRELNIKER